MMKFTRITLILIAALFSNLVFAKERIVIASDMWCPYNCDPKSANQGFLIEIARNIFEKQNISVEYRLMPWSDALEALENGEIHAIAGASKTDDRDFIYPENYQALEVVNCYIRKDMDWYYAGINSISGKILGLTLNYKYPYEVSLYIDETFPIHPENFLFSTGENAVAANINNLKNGKAEIYLENANVMDAYLSHNPDVEIKEAGSVNSVPTEIYIAFSPKIKKSHIYAKILSDGMMELRNSGHLSGLYKKYGVYTGFAK
jgi:polar amino acid transport system substrate-binding protein